MDFKPFADARVAFDGFMSSLFYRASQYTDDAILHHKPVG